MFRRANLSRVLLGLVAALVATSALHAQAAWRFLGPAPIENVQFAGRIAGLAVSATHPDNYYAVGASGGVWVTENGGHTWRALTDQLPTTAMGAIALDPNDERVVYAGSGESHNAYHSLYGLGMYKSTNSGALWQVLASETFSGLTFARIVVAPDGTVWAAVARAGGTLVQMEGAKLHPNRLGTKGLFRSGDGGQSWTSVTSGLPQTTATDIELVAQNPNRMYVCFSDPFGDAGNGVYRSTDGGVSFQRILSTAGLGRTELAVAPSDPDRLYALVTNPASGVTNGGFFPPGSSTFGIYRSDDGGANWTFINTGNFQGGQGIYDSTIIVHPADRDTFVVGGVFMLRSSDGGATFVNITPPHVDIHDLKFDAAGRLVAGTDGGVYRSADLGDSWESRNRTLGNLQFYPGISSDPSNREGIIGGLQDNGTNLRTSPSTDWNIVLGGDGGFTAFVAQSPGTFFAEVQGAGLLIRSDDGGLSIIFAGFGIDFNDRSAFQAPLQLDPNNPRRALYATHRVYETTTIGDFLNFWTPISGDLTGGAPFAVRSLLIAPSNSQTVYATTNDQRLLVSTDGGANFTLARTDAYGWPRIMRQLAVDPLDDTVAYVAIARFGGDRVLRTTDRGQTWTSIGAGLPDVPVNTVAVTRRGGDRLIFAGTDQGVFLSRDEGTTWTSFSQQLPNAPVNDLVVDGVFDRLIAGTLGRGVWVTPLPN